MFKPISVSLFAFDLEQFDKSFLKFINIHFGHLSSCWCAELPRVPLQNQSDWLTLPAVTLGAFRKTIEAGRALGPPIVRMDCYPEQAHSGERRRIPHGSSGDAPS